MAEMLKLFLFWEVGWAGWGDKVGEDSGEEDDADDEVEGAGEGTLIWSSPWGLLGYIECEGGKGICRERGGKA